MDMKEDELTQRESISALADGQLRGDAFARAVQAVAQDAEAQATWDTYHLIGDVLRTGALDARVRDRAFVARFAARLEREPVLLRPVAAVVEPDAVLLQARAAQAVHTQHVEAANAPNYRWKLVAGLASMAAVAAIGWNLAGGLGTAQQPQLALVSPQQPAAVVPVAVGAAQATSGTESTPMMLRDPRLDELLAAHKQFGGASALQMPAGFLRNATFEGGGR